MLVTKIGDDLAVRLPQEVVEALHLREGDNVEVKPAGERSLEVERPSTDLVEKDPAKRLELIKEFREKWTGWLPADFKFDRDEANER